MRSPSRLAIAAPTACHLNALLTVALLTVASAARADDTDNAVTEFLDLNGDHKISYDDFVHSIAVKAMREMDEDKNGLLSPAEGASSGSKGDASSPAISFSKADTDGNGQVSFEELSEAIHANTGTRALFQNLDKDGDGSLSGPELKSIHGVPLIRLPF